MIASLALESNVNGRTYLEVAYLISVFPMIYARHPRVMMNYKQHLVMAALRSRCGHYIFVL